MIADPYITMAQFAELVFAYIDELSAASVAGHADELATAERSQERRLERLALDLVRGASEEVSTRRAEGDGRRRSQADFS